MQVLIIKIGLELVESLLQVLINKIGLVINECQM
jgi:hypothetical protein